MASDNLHPLLRSVNKSVSNLREDVQKLTREVRKVHTAITKGVKSIQEAIYDSIEAQAELKLMEHVMEVKSVKPQIEAEHDQIRTEREELEERLESIGDRYRRKHQELDETAARRVRDVGSHIFKIDEEQFEEGVEEPFVDQVTTAWHTLQAHNTEVGDERNERLRSTTGDVVQTIHDFVDRQSTLVERIGRHRLDDPSLASETGTGRIQIPYYVVEYEVDGVTNRETIVPSRLTSSGASTKAGSGERWCTAELDPIPGAESVLDEISGPSSGVETSLDPGTVESVLSEYGNSNLLGQSYAKEAAKTLPGGVPIVVEGGDDGGDH
jgi:uncharacterized protein YoxC